MRTFESNGERSHKFWTIDLQEKAVRVTHGRIGTPGKTRVRKYAGDDEARKAYFELIAEQLQEGYVETTSSGPPSATKFILEQALVHDPDDLAAYAAYADYLAEQGDPRGELIQVQLALEDPARSAGQRKQLQKREKTLLQKHHREWLGDLAPYLLDKRGLRVDYPDMEPQFQLARGWLDILRVSILTGELARALAAAPEIRLLRTLCISDVDDFSYGESEEEEPDYPGLSPLAESPYLGNVRRFEWGGWHDLGDDDYRYNSFASSFIRLDALRLVEGMTRIEELYLNADNMISGQDLFGLSTMTRLRVLQFCLGDSYPLATLARNPALGQLTHLLLHPKAVEEGADAHITLAGVRALVRSRHLPSLTHLRLHQTDMGDRGCEEIVRSGILGRLKVLDLAYGNMTDEGAHTLAACPDLVKLEYLDVSHNGLTDEGIDELEAVGIRVRAEDQHEPGDTYYLYEGDIE